MLISKRTLPSDGWRDPPRRAAEQAGEVRERLPTAIDRRVFADTQVSAYRLAA